MAGVALERTSFCTCVQCPACTFLNVAGAFECAMCGMQLVEGAPPSGAAECEECGAVNDPFAASCIACGAVFDREGDMSPGASSPDSLDDGAEPVGGVAPPPVPAGERVVCAACTFEQERGAVCTMCGTPLV